MIIRHVSGFHQEVEKDVNEKDDVNGECNSHQGAVEEGFVNWAAFSPETKFIFFGIFLAPLIILWEYHDDWCSKKRVNDTERDKEVP